VQQFTTISEQRSWSRAQRQAGRTVALVPTMGALHAGHLSLVKLARSRCAQVVVSIFINPTQFDRPEDFAKYPMTVEADLALLAAAGVDAVFLPTTEAMYPQGYCTFIEVVGPLTDKLCAVARPGHFRGVATVVTKLFNAVEPDVAVFGQKDLQQVLIVGRLVRDLDLPIEIVVGPTLREADGLAMSSRNSRLTPAGRINARAVPRGLELANRAFNASEHVSMKLTAIVAEEILMHEGTEVDYADVVDMDGFKEVEFATDRCILAVAAFVDGVRLIDHIRLGSPPLPVAIEED